MNRREFLKSSIVAGASLATSGLIRGDVPSLRRRAQAMVLIWLPGGVAQTDTWDPKQYTPFIPGMPAAELRGTCPLIPTAADGVWFGAGLERIASVMDRGVVLRSLTNLTHFGSVHLQAQHYMMTGHLFPAGAAMPGMGAIVSRSLGRREPDVPAYFVLGAAAQTSAPEAAFIETCRGPGFLGAEHAPRRMTSTGGFEHDCRRAVELVDAGARFVQVEFPYEAFGGFDLHEHAAQRMIELKRRIDAPIAELVLDLERRGLLERTLVVVASEFGRTVAHEPGLITDERAYGFHGHFSACSAMLLLGCGVRQGAAYGRSADEHPMVAVENPVTIEDVHATIYHLLGISPETRYLAPDGREFPINNGGVPIAGLLA